MKDFITVKPEKDRLVNILTSIEKGEIRVPEFQRSLVWDEAQMKDLFDSIVKGYPIGSLLLWMPDEKYKCYEYFGPYKIKIVKQYQTKYILDGCQRLTTLFGCLLNPSRLEPHPNGPDVKRFSIYYNLKDESFTYSKTKVNQSYLMPLHKIVDTFEYLDFLKKLQDDKTITNIDKEAYINSAKKVSKILLDYEVPFTIINGGDINSAVEIFSRVNSKGTDISEDWMLSALLYNENNDFLLSNKITVFLNKMQQYKFHTLKRDTVLNCIASAASADKIYFDVKIEDLADIDKTAFEEITNQTFANIEKAITFLYSRLHVIDQKLLPYPSQLIFITDFFRLNPRPSELLLSKLVDWFWITSYANYFTVYSLSQQRRAYSIFRRFALGEHENGILPFSEDDIFGQLTLFKTQPFPKKLDFGSVRSKVLQLFILNVYLEDEPIFDAKLSLKEKFIFIEKDKSPGNILLYAAFDDSKTNQANSIIDLPYLIDNVQDLSHIFINDELKLRYKDDILDFIIEREQHISNREKVFISKFKFLSYTSIR
jgi:uncharacterized protein with ParB-like and HNH nuclease domain